MDYMEQALSLAKLALGQVSPNPAVGAVVVNNGVVVGQGYTQPAGSHHAEIVALEQAGEQARGGVLYVTWSHVAIMGGLLPVPSSTFITALFWVLHPISFHYICENMDDIHKLEYVAWNIANSTFVDAPHLETFFHARKQR